jgi:hypothetical protein
LCTPAVIAAVIAVTVPAATRRDAARRHRLTAARALLKPRGDFVGAPRPHVRADHDAWRETFVVDQSEECRPIRDNAGCDKVGVSPEPRSPWRWCGLVASPDRLSR